MARGRFISSTLGASKKFRRVTNDTHRLMYVLMVTHADVEGRLEADPDLLNGLCFTLMGWTTNQVNEGLADLANVGLIHWYELDDERFVEIVDFHRHNTVRKDREAASEIPPPEKGTPARAHGNSGPTPDLLRSESRASPAQVQGEVEVEGEGQARGRAREATTNIHDSPEARFQRLARTGNSERGEKARVRSCLRRHAGQDFARQHEDDLDSWTRWTNEQIHELWDASDPQAWRDEEHKQRAWIFADLLNQKRTPPGQRPPDPLELVRKYHGAKGTTQAGVEFEVIGGGPDGRTLMTDRAGYLTPEQVDAACHAN